MKDLQFPVGISNFSEIRTKGYYYIDKTNLVAEILDGGIPKVNLITRPRRFGKSLGMSTLANFLDITKDTDNLGNHEVALQEIANLLDGIFENHLVRNLYGDTDIVDE